MRNKICLFLSLISTSYFGAYALYPPTKNIRQSGGFGLGLSYPITGSSLESANKNTTFKIPPSPQFSFELNYGNRKKDVYFEYGLKFQQFKNAYYDDLLRSDTIYYSLLSTYIQTEARVVFHSIGEVSRNLYGFSGGPGFGIRQQKMEYRHVNKHHEFYTSENYYKNIRKFNIDLGIFVAKEFDLSNDVTLRYELNAHWNTIFSKVLSPSISQIRFGFSGFVLFTR